MPRRSAQHSYGPPSFPLIPENSHATEPKTCAICGDKALFKCGNGKSDGRCHLHRLIGKGQV